MNVGYETSVETDGTRKVTSLYTDFSYLKRAFIQKEATKDDEVVNRKAMVNYAKTSGVFTLTFYAGNPLSGWIGLASGTGVSFERFQVIVPAKSLMKKLFINIYRGPGGTNTFTFQVYKNGVPVGPSKVIAEPVELQSSIEVNAPFEEGDGVAINLTLTGSFGPGPTSMVGLFQLIQ